MTIFFVGCFPEKPTQSNLEGQLIVRITLDEPIHAQPSGATFVNHFLSLTSSIGDAQIFGSNPSHVGIKTFQVTGQGESNDELTFNVSYSDYSVDASNVTTSDCDSLTIRVLFEGAVIYEEVKEMGYSNCTNGFGGLSTTLTLP